MEVRLGPPSSWALAMSKVLKMAMMKTTSHRRLRDEEGVPKQKLDHISLQYNDPYLLSGMLATVFLPLVLVTVSYVRVLHMLWIMYY